MSRTRAPQLDGDVPHGTELARSLLPRRMRELGRDHIAAALDCIGGQVGVPQWRCSPVESLQRLRVFGVSPCRNLAQWQGKTGEFTGTYHARVLQREERHTQCGRSTICTRRQESKTRPHLPRHTDPDPCSAPWLDPWLYHRWGLGTHRQGGQSGMVIP